MVNKRKFLIGTYDTAEHLWTLAAWNLSDPEQVRSWVDVPGRRKGPIDASTVLSDGDPVYGNRTLTITLESSEGTRLEREARIEQMLNWLDGWWLDIVLPDDVDTHHRYMRGTVSVKKIYNTLAQAQVQVTAVCEPWKYAAAETIVPAFLCGKNLFNNADLVPLYSTGASTAQISTGLRATWASGSSACQILRLLPLDVIAGQTVTLSATMTPHGAGTPSLLLGYVAAGGSPRVIVTKLRDTGSMTMQVEKLEGYDYLGLWVYANSSTPVADMSAGDYIDYTNIQLELGDKVTAYTAYSAGAASPQSVVLTNDRLVVCPLVTVQGTIRLVNGASSYALTEGVYQLPDVLLTASGLTLQVSGTGAVGFRYRKAVL